MVRRYLVLSSPFLASLHHGQESLIFRHSPYTSPTKIGSRTKPPWCPWENLSSRNFSKPEVPSTANNMQRAHARKVSWWTLASHCFRSSCLLPLPFVISAKVLLWHTGDRFQWHLSIPQRRSLTHIWRPSIFSHRNRQSPLSLFPLSLQPGGTQFLCTCNLGMSTPCLIDSEKRSLPATLEVWTDRERAFGRSDGLHSFYCMHYALRVSLTFWCPPPFCARNFDE